jgi:hypothetical protein
MAAQHLPRAFREQDGTPKYKSIVIGYCYNCGCSTCLCDDDPLETSNEHSSSIDPYSFIAKPQATTPACGNAAQLALQDGVCGTSKPSSIYSKRSAIPEGRENPTSRAKFTPPTNGPAVHHWLKKRIYRDRRGAQLDRNGLTLATEALGYADGLLLHL